MQKEFTVNVPDEIWVNRWEDGLTETYTYEGPQYFYIGLSANSPVKTLFGDLSEESPGFTDEESAEFDQIVEIDAEINPEIAHAIYVTDHEEHTFTDVENHDGSIYKLISNPCLKDYFTLGFQSSEDPLKKEAVLTPIYKETENKLSTVANSRLSLIKKYNDSYDFSTEDQAKIDNYISNITSYLDSISEAYPWKYIEINVAEIPKIPVDLQLLFNQLPEID